MGKFSTTLKDLRVSAGLTQEQLADALGTSRSLIGMYEAGKRMPSYEMLETIADYFNISLGRLGSSEPEISPEQKELEELLEEIRRSPDLRAMFSLAKGATPEEVRQYINVIKAIRGDDQNG